MFNIDVVMDLKTVQIPKSYLSGNIYTLTLTGGDPDHDTNDSTIGISLSLGELRMIHDKIHDLLMENV